MSTETHGISDDQVRSAFQRWKNLEKEKARIADDLKELFAEQKAFGHDTKAMRAAFRLKVKMDEARPEDAEHEALVDTYLAALEAPRASRAYAREKIGEFCSDAGLNIVTKHTEITASPETATEVPAQDGGGTALGKSHGDKSNAARPASVDAQPNGRGSAGKDEESVVTAGETATISPEEAEEEFPSADGNAAANAGGPDVARSATRAGLADPTSNTGEGAANTALPAKPKVSFRPNCQHPENCASGTRDHCWSCRRAMQKSEEMA